MGYDMYQLVEPPKAQYEKAAYSAKAERLKAALTELREQGAKGSWLTPSEQVSLDDKGQQEARRVRGNRWRNAYMDEHGDDTPRLEMNYLELRAQTIPATEEYIAALRAYEDHIFSTARHQEYFRLNGFGMGRYAEEMFTLGMLKDTRRGSESWPDHDLDSDLVEVIAEAYYLSSDRPSQLSMDPAVHEGLVRKGMQESSWIETFGPGGKEHMPVSDADIKAFAEWQVEHAKHLGKHDDTVPGIESIKFSSNDGWWVTPEECRTAVAAWSAHPKERRQETVDKLGDYWLLWIEYIHNGALGNGFSVH